MYLYICLNCIAYEKECMIKNSKEICKNLWVALNSIMEQVKNIKHLFICELITTVKQITGQDCYIQFDKLDTETFTLNGNCCEIGGAKVDNNKLYLYEVDFGWIELNEFEFEIYDLYNLVVITFSENNQIVPLESDTEDECVVQSNEVEKQDAYVVMIRENYNNGKYDSVSVGAVASDADDAQYKMYMIAHDILCKKNVYLHNSNVDTVRLYSTKYDIPDTLVTVETIRSFDEE